jgi:protease-4
MKTLWHVMLLIIALAVPALGDEKKNGAVDTKEMKSEKKVKHDDDSPIPRLAEMKIDEFVTSAKLMNLPLPGRTRTVQDLLEKMEEWSKDKKIGAVLLDLGGVSLSYPYIEELRHGIFRMQDAGKKVMAFMNGGSDYAYLLACAADEIATPATGGIMLPGIGRVFPFMKGYQQMVGREAQVITAGRYKYPGFLNRRKPDKYFKEEFGAILDSWIYDYKKMIADGRNLSMETVAKIVDIALFNATQAQQRGLVDTLAFYEDYRDHLVKRYKMKLYKEDDEGLAKVNSIQDFVELINKELKKAEEARKAVGPKIAVLHARGPIIDISMGASFANQLICRDDFIKVVDELRKNRSIKAVVMHIDSPGGSGYASDMIWKQLRKLDEVKPLVVSMGTVAGSGGYYLSCPARRIFALPTTITGSIGVLGVFESSWSALNRMDYEMFEMSRGARSLLGNGHKTLDKEDIAFIQKWMDDFYGVFIDRVATTRRIPAEKVREVAEGRVWSGRQALEIGLIDELGGLHEAIQAARTMANIPPSAELKIVHYPRGASLGELFEGLSAVSVNMQSVAELFKLCTMPAKPVTFEEQIGLFSRKLQPLCWMAIPDFYRPQSSLNSAPWDLLQMQEEPGSLIEKLLLQNR